MTATDHDVMLRDREGRRLLRQEELILEVTEVLARALAVSGVTQAALARRLGKSNAFVSQVLSGGRNLTLRTVADLADALGFRIVVKACPEERRSVAGLEDLKRFSWEETVGWRPDLWPANGNLIPMVDQPERWGSTPNGEAA